MNENLHTTLQDPTVKEVAEKIDAAVPEESRDDFQRIVAAGMSILFGEKSQNFIKETSAQLTQGGKDIGIIVGSTMRLWETIAQASQNKSDPQASWFALMTLSLHSIDYFDRIGRVVVTPEFMGEFFTALSGAFLKYNDIGPEQMQDAIKAGRDKMTGATPEQAPEQAPAPQGGLMGQAGQPALAGQGVPV